MRIVTTIRHEDEVLQFAKAAAVHFETHPKNTSYGDLMEPLGKYLALRWGLLNRAVLILKLDENFGVRVYTDAIAPEFARIQL